MPPGMETFPLIFFICQFADFKDDGFAAGRYRRVGACPHRQCPVLVYGVRRIILSTEGNQCAASKEERWAPLKGFPSVTSPHPTVLSLNCYGAVASGTVASMVLGAAASVVSGTVASVVSGTSGSGAVHSTLPSGEEMAM